MRIIILFALLSIPYLLKAQEQKAVETVISPDYKELINQQKVTTYKSITDSSNSILSGNLRIKYSYFLSGKIDNLKQKGNQVIAIEKRQKTLDINSNYAASIGITAANQQPKLQNDFVQGRNENGNLVWRGADKNEAFSYGPSINSLWYDGSNYQYDSNGQLVNTNTGNATAKSYNNKITQSGFSFTQNLSTQAKLFKNWQNYWLFIVRASHSYESLIIQRNKNLSKNIFFEFEKIKKKFQYNASYMYGNKEFSNSNRSGFLNKTYQNALLTPISFNNAENALVLNGQQRYYDRADNPKALLDNNNGQHQNKHIANMSVAKKQGDFTFSLAPVIQYFKDDTREIYKVNTADFLNGVEVARTKEDRSMSIPFQASYKFKDRSDTNMEIASYQTLSKDNTNIQYFKDYSNKYNYTRNIYESSLNFQWRRNSYKNDFGFIANNKFYASSTLRKNKFFLPTIGFFYKRDEIFDHNLNAKISGQFISSANELSIGQSYANNWLLIGNTAAANSFIANNELPYYNKTNAILQRHFNTALEITYNRNWSLNLDLFLKNTKDDIFPVFENNNLALKNIADHLTKGIEIELRYANYKKIQFESRATFNAYNTMVTNVANGYNNTPLVGFSNVHKALVKGNQLGAIVGNRYLRDASNNIIIGNDGYPLVDNRLGVIGNPIPKFIVKQTNTIKYKRFSSALEFEWRKGGDIWNGTQAVLDYYGRSEQSGQQRNITNYIFEGVTNGGIKNNVPVNFYDLNLPLSENRWIRYGQTGVAESYIEKGDQIKLNNISIAYTIPVKKHLQEIQLSVQTNNIVLWSANEGVDSNQLLYDLHNSSGINFFNLPSTQFYGFSLKIKY